MAELGIMLEARAVHTGRSARNHLLALAQTNGVPAKRVSEVIDMVGLAGVAGKRVGGFSLGMGQRLGVAAALLGDPQTVVLDEPVNGLDPEGVLWIRHLLRALADEGRTVFISSHLMSEMALTAQHLIIVGRGRLIADTTVDGFIAQASGSVTLWVPITLSQSLTWSLAPSGPCSSARSRTRGCRGPTGRCWPRWPGCCPEAGSASCASSSPRAPCCAGTTTSSGGTGPTRAALLAGPGPPRPCGRWCW
jgi:hypothetical protein